MALGIQIESGVPIADWWAWLSAATPFQAIDEIDRRELVEHMLAAEILAESGGRYSFGERGEKLYGWRNFAELYAVSRRTTCWHAFSKRRSARRWWSTTSTSGFAARRRSRRPRS